jgi:hypothetical protein
LLIGNATQWRPGSAPASQFHTLAQEKVLRGTGPAALRFKNFRFHCSVPWSNAHASWGQFSLELLRDLAMSSLSFLKTLFNQEKSENLYIFKKKTQTRIES